MPFQRPSLTTIRGRIETDITSRLTGSAALLRHALLKILGVAYAGAAHSLHGHADFLSKQLFVATAEGVFLDRIAFEYGLVRNAAVKATGTFRFTGVNGAEVPSGTRVQNDDGTVYTTNASGTISGGVADIVATCSEAGEVGNTPINAAFTTVSPVTGVSSTVNGQTAFTGGVDIETDDSLRSRLLFKRQNPGNGGNKADYENWAREVAGVAKAFVLPTYYGAGTVAIVVTATGSDPVPSGGLVTSVQANIDAKRPVTASATVSAIAKVETVLTIAVTPNTAAIRAAIDASLKELFEGEATPGGTILASHIREAIMASGVTDFNWTNTHLNGAPVGSAGNIVGTAFQYHVAAATHTYSSL